MALNIAVFYGHMVRDPRVGTSRGGQKYASGTIAVDRDYLSVQDGERPVDFIDFFAWGATGENLVKYFPQGKACILIGRIETYNVEGIDGTKLRKTRLNCQRCYFAGKKSDLHRDEDAAPFDAKKKTYQPTLCDDFFDDEEWEGSSE